MRVGTLGVRYAIGRLHRFLHPRLTVTPTPAGVRFERDVEVAVRDGTVLRVNVFRPEAEGEYPVVMCAHPYGKDKMIRAGRFGARVPVQLRLLLQDTPIRVSEWTSWEAPDPGFWVPGGYVVVNCDLRGFGHSDGVGSLFSDAEAEDYYDLIEWAAAQPWSNGRVGLNGVSYLAISQWKVAALRPPHLAAICAWEGLSDVYRDLAYPGGIRENAFVRVWSAMVRRGGNSVDDLRREQLARPLRDEWWASHAPALERIEVPALICGSFSDQGLHSGGSFRAFESISSPQRWLYTHRGGKWAVYYSPEALAVQQRFFDHFLKGEDNGMNELPPARLEVRESRQEISSVREEAAWPLPGTDWTPLHLHPDGSLREAAAEAPGWVRFDTRNGRASFSWLVPAELELVGSMNLRLHLEAEGSDDVNLFAGVRKLRDGCEVPFEGSYGFGRDLVTRGWLKASHRRLDEQASEPRRPVHSHVAPEPLRAGEIVAAEFELLPSATLFRRGETLRLDVQGRWFFRDDPFLGQFPAAYEASPPATVILHCGGRFDAQLLAPRASR